MIQKSESKMFVQLATVFDAYRFSQLSINAQIQELNKPDGNIFFEIISLNDASLLCRKFIDRFDLGSSNWVGGKIIDEQFNFIAKISYNGRIWDNEDWRKANEILC